MPEVDLETTPVSVAAAGGAEDSLTKSDVTTGDDDAADVEPDLPPESFWLSKDAEYDWFDRNAVYERKESTKGNSNNSTNLNPSINHNFSSNSQRPSVNLKSKASIIGLPKTQKTTFVDSKRRICKPPNMRLFPKRSESSGKQTAVPAAAEPGSPKVSCMGRVRSKRCRRRSNSLKRKEKPPVEKSTGFYSKVMSMFRSNKGHRKSSRSGSRKVVEVTEEDPPPSAAAEPQRKSVSLRVSVGGETAAEAPGLGGVKRFTSGRRSGSWAAEDFNQVISVTLDSDRRVGPVSRS